MANFEGSNAAMNNESGIQTPTIVFQRQHDDARPCLDLMGGTEAMRAAGDKYIPRKEAEKESKYLARVNRTVLRNAFAQTVGYYRGQVFSRDVSLDNNSSGLSDEDMERFNAWAEDVDQRGHNLTSWSGGVFESGLVSGVTFCLVDYPHVETISEDGVLMYRSTDGTMRPKTAAVDASEGWQPYLVHIPAEQVLDCRAEWRKGRRVITHFRYIETRQEQSETNQWQLEEVKYVHTYWLDRWELWKSAVATGKTAAGFEKVAEGRMTLDEIPVAVFMPGTPKSDFTARPALMDLAQLNIWHWQSTSEQNDLLAFVRLPVWTVVGAEQERGQDGKPVPIPFGPGNVLWLPQGGSVQSAGVNPASVESGRQDLRDIEDSMATYGLQVMRESASYRVTATQVEQRTRESNSQLKNWALDFKDFLENCLRFVAKWWGLPDGPSAQVNDDYANSVNYDDVKDLYNKHLVSGKTLSDVAKRLGILPDDFNYADEAARIAQDAANTANGGQSLAMSLAQRLGRGGNTANIGTGISGESRENPGVQGR